MAVDDKVLLKRYHEEGDLQAREELARHASGELDLRRLLDTVVDRYDVVAGDGGDWIQLSKAVR